VNGGIGPEDAELGVEAPDDVGVLPRPELHIDITAEELNWQTFTVPLILNLVVAAVIGLRVYNGGIGPEDAELGVEAPDDVGVLPRPERRDDFAMVPLSPDEVYLVHIDITAEELNWQTFTVPLILNLVAGLRMRSLVLRLRMTLASCHDLSAVMISPW
jgi:sRNA-binding carbon storage regulator CsrA